MSGHRARSLSLVVAAVVAFTLGGAVIAVGLVDGVIEACSNDTTGVLRLATPAKPCQTNASSPVFRETEISWNQLGPQGPQGATGAQGPQGATGAQGLPGASNVYATFRENGDLRGAPIAVPRQSFVGIGRLSVPAGSYLVTGYIWFQNDDLGSAAIAQCLVNSGSHAAQFLDTVPSPASFGLAANRTTAFSVAGTFSEPGTVALSCRNQNGSGGDLTITTFDLNAVQTGPVTYQTWP